ncbi:MAG: hypothetical protein ACREKL_11600 [Chthoniobacterales bacterium]
MAGAGIAVPLIDAISTTIALAAIATATAALLPLLTHGLPLRLLLGRENFIHFRPRFLECRTAVLATHLATRSSKLRLKDRADFLRLIIGQSQIRFHLLHPFRTALLGIASAAIATKLPVATALTIIACVLAIATVALKIPVRLPVAAAIIAGIGLGILGSIAAILSLRPGSFIRAGDIRSICCGIGCGLRGNRGSLGLARGVQREHGETHDGRGEQAFHHEVFNPAESRVSQTFFGRRLCHAL